jgi:glycosyltransferase involved in cell wall biosynthesis
VRCPTFVELPSPPPGKTGWPWTDDGIRMPDVKPPGARSPRVSIVTPSYNQGHFIEETIRSVLLQGYPDLEYIIIDGGSSDSTTAIIRKYEDWLTYWVSEPDEGQTEAIKKGWSLATGEVVAYINADDAYLPGAVAVAADAFRARPDAGMVYGTAVIVDDSGRELRPWRAQPFDVRRMLTRGSIVPQPATFFSAAALEEVGSLDERWNMIMDYELAIRMGTRYPAISVSESLARFRDHGKSKSRLRFEAIADELIQFVGALSPTGMSHRKWRRVRRATLSRIYVELAFAYLAQDKQETAKASSQVVRSALADPAWMVRRPLTAAHLARQMLTAYVSALHRPHRTT